MELNDFRMLAQGIQAIAISLAAILGGIWAVFKLYSSKELDKSRAEAIRLQRELETRKGLRGAIKVQIGQPLENQMIPVFFEVVIENESKETHTLDWNGSPLKIASIQVEESDSHHAHVVTPIAKLRDLIILPEHLDQYSKSSIVQTILPETSCVLHYYWECSAQGIYFACVSAPMPDSIVKYAYSSDSDQTLTAAEEKHEKELKFNFYTVKYFQVVIPSMQHDVSCNEKPTSLSE